MAAPTLSQFDQLSFTYHWWYHQLISRQFNTFGSVKNICYALTCRWRWSELHWTRLARRGLRCSTNVYMLQEFHRGRHILGRRCFHSVQNNERLYLRILGQFLTFHRIQSMEIVYLCHRITKCLLPTLKLYNIHCCSYWINEENLSHVEAHYWEWNRRQWPNLIHILQKYTPRRSFSFGLKVYQMWRMCFFALTLLTQRFVLWAPRL